MARPKRVMPRVIAAALLGSTPLALVGCQAAARPPRAIPAPVASARRPNIVLILTDDLDLAPVAHMPTLLSRVAEQGVSFRHALVTTPVCGPSRTSILTGRYAHNHGFLGNKPPIGGYRKFLEGGHENANVATHLSTAGYQTALIGKYLNRYPGRDEPHVPPGWTVWQGVFFPESYYRYRMNVDGEVKEAGEEAEEYLTDVLRDRAVEFIKTADRARPFFLYLSPFAPHAPAIAADRHDKLFSDAKAPRPPSFNEEDVSDKPTWLRALPRMTDDTIAKSDEWYQRRLRTLQAVDEMIGAVLDALEAAGQTQDTYLFFTSDNGFQLGAHRLDHGKGDAYEESIHVPMMVRGPGVPARRALDHIVLNIDLTPTVLALAGVSIPEDLDGRSFAELLGPRPPALKQWRQDALIESWTAGTRRVERDSDNEGEGGIPDYAALRTVDHLFVEYSGSNERELYDLRKDPYQLDNALSTASVNLVQRLQARLTALKSCRGPNCR